MVGERRDVRKSKEAIKNAFIQLIINQDIRKITVKDFLDIYDVQEQVENDLMDHCIQVIGENSIDNIIDDPYPQVLRCIQFLVEHAETIRSLSQGNQNGAFITKYKVILKEGLFRSSHSITNNVTLSVVDACIVGAVVEGGMEKIIRGIPLNAEETARIISRFISRGIKGMIE